MKSNRASLFHSAPPDRNASPAARPWGRITPRNGSPSGSRALPLTGGRAEEAPGKSPCESPWRTVSRPSSRQASAVGEAAQLEAGRQFLANFITEHQIDSYEGLENRLAEISAANDAAAAEQRRRTPPWGYGAADKKPLRLQAAPTCGAGTAKRQRQGRVPAAA